MKQNLNEQNIIWKFLEKWKQRKLGKLAKSLIKDNPQLEKDLRDLDNKTDESISSNKSQIIDKLQVLWKPEEISIIYELIKHINRLHNKGERDLYINIVDQIILSKEEWVYNYILDISSTYNK